MAQVVLITSKNARPGITAVGDVVSIHDDDVALMGAGYADSDIIKIPGLTAKEVRAAFSKVLPDVQVAIRTTAKENVWAFEDPQYQKVWKNSEEKWCFYNAPVKHKITMKALTKEALALLADEGVSNAAKILILEGQCAHNFDVAEDNKVEVSDLNA